VKFQNFQKSESDEITGAHVSNALSAPELYTIRHRKHMCSASDGQTDLRACTSRAGPGVYLYFL
jgi:hypothetical protein